MCERVDVVFKLKTSGKQPLPDPNGELSAKIPSSGISSANACVGKLLDGDGPQYCITIVYSYVHYKDVEAFWCA